MVELLTADEDPSIIPPSGNEHPDTSRMLVENFLLQTGPIVRVEDYKLTKLGIPLEGPEGSPTPIVKATIEKFQDYKYNMMQAMGYCYALECDEFIHHVVYVNGNYKTHRGWFYQAYKTTFTVEELVRNWTLVRAQKSFERGPEGPQVL